MSNEPRPKRVIDVAQAMVNNKVRYGFWADDQYRGEIERTRFLGLNDAQILVNGTWHNTHPNHYIEVTCI